MTKMDDAKKMYIFLDATFDEIFTSPLRMPDLTYQDK